MKTFKVGDKVYDRWWPSYFGEVTDVLKTRVKINFYSREEWRKYCTYDMPHTQFLEILPKVKARNKKRSR